VTSQNSGTETPASQRPGFPTIVLATDFSEGARVAGRYAALFAQHFHARLIVAHAFTLAQPALEVETLQHVSSVQRQDLEQQLKETVEILPPVSGGVSTLLAETSPVRMIRDLTEHGEQSLIVLATHGGSALERHIIGSVAEEILRTVQTPVLTVGPHAGLPPASDRLAFRRILYATDFSPAAAAAAPYALALAQAFGSEIDLMHVLSGSAIPRSPQRLQEQEQAFREALNQHLVTQAAAFGASRTFVESGEVRDRIVAHARERDVDLIVLGAHHHSHLAMRFRTGPAFQVIIAAECPVLTISRS